MPDRNHERERQLEQQGARQFESDDPRHPCQAALKIAAEALQIAQNLDTVTTGNLPDGRHEPDQIDKAQKNSLFSRMSRQEDKWDRLIFWLGLLKWILAIPAVALIGWVTSIIGKVLYQAGGK